MKGNGRRERRKRKKRKIKNELLIYTCVVFVTFLLRVVEENND